MNMSCCWRLIAGGDNSPAAAIKPEEEEEEDTMSSSRMSNDGKHEGRHFCWFHVDVRKVSASSSLRTAGSHMTHGRHLVFIHTTTFTPQTAGNTLNKWMRQFTHSNSRIESQLPVSNQYILDFNQPKRRQ